MSQAGSLIAGAGAGGGGREGDVVRMEVGEAVMGDGLEAGLGAILGIVRRLWNAADCGVLRSRHRRSDDRGLEIYICNI